MFSDVPPRKTDDDEEEDDEFEKMDDISDEGIEEGASDRDSPPRDYLISTVSKVDLDLMSNSSSSSFHPSISLLFSKKNITVMMKNPYH